MTVRKHEPSLIGALISGRPDFADSGKIIRRYCLVNATKMPEKINHLKINVYLWLNNIFKKLRCIS